MRDRRSTLTSDEIAESKRLVNDFFNRSRPLSESMPVYLLNGSRVDELTGKCYQCKRVIPDDQQRGEIMPSREGVCVTAFGYCSSCRLISPLMVDVVVVGKSFDVRYRRWLGWRRSEVTLIERK